MMKKKIDYRVALFSSLIIALITSVNRIATLSYHDWYPVFFIFVLNFSASIACWGVVYLAEFILRRTFGRPKQPTTRLSKIIKNQIIKFIASSIIGLGILLTATGSMYSFFIHHDPFLFNANLSFDQYLTIAGIRFITLIIAIQMIKNMFDLLAERQRILVENEKLKLATLNAQFQSLKQQLNPHFLFNSLNTLKSMVKSNDVHAEAFVLRLSEIYRYILQNQHNDLVSIREELNILQAYIFMLKARFEDSLTVNITIDEAILDSCLLPPFTMQLLIENATKHNIVSQAKPLCIDVYNIGDDRIVVKNSLQPKRNTETSTGVGLENIHKRCTYLCGRGIEITKTTGEFIVEIPLITKNENRYS